MPKDPVLPRIVRRRSKLHGWGVFALEPINKNTRIVTYDGELIDHKESLKRETQVPEARRDLVLHREPPMGARRDGRRQRRPVHQPRVQAELLQPDRREGDLDSRRPQHRAG